MKDLYMLKMPFPAKDIEWRVQRAGAKNGNQWAMVLAYVTNRAIMDRLDSVVGSGRWKNRYEPGPQGGIICGLSILIHDEWVTKWDGAENTDIEAVKGGLSNAMKRAAVQWGIGRYLYNLEANYVNADPNGKHYQPGKQGKYESFKWNAPQLPEWALPPNAEKRQYLENPALSSEEKDYILTHELTEDLKYRLDETLSGRSAQ